MARAAPQHAPQVRLEPYAAPAAAGGPPSAVYEQYDPEFFQSGADAPGKDVLAFPGVSRTYLDDELLGVPGADGGDGSEGGADWADRVFEPYNWFYYRDYPVAPALYGDSVSELVDTEAIKESIPKPPLYYDPALFAEDADADTTASMGGASAGASGGPSPAGSARRRIGGRPGRGQAGSRSDDDGAASGAETEDSEDDEEIDALEGAARHARLRMRGLSSLGKSSKWAHMTPEERQQRLGAWLARKEKQLRLRRLEREVKTLETLMRAASARETNDQQYQAWCSRKDSESRQERLDRATTLRKLQQVRGEAARHVKPRPPSAGPKSDVDGDGQGAPTYEEWLAMKLARNKRIRALLARRELARKVLEDDERAAHAADIEAKVIEWRAKADAHAAEEMRRRRESERKAREEAQEKKLRCESTADFDAWMSRRVPQLVAEKRRRAVAADRAEQDRQAANAVKARAGSDEYTRWLRNQRLVEAERREALQALEAEAIEVERQERRTRWARKQLVLAYQAQPELRNRPAPGLAVRFAPRGQRAPEAKSGLLKSSGRGPAPSSASARGPVPRPSTSPLASSSSAAAAAGGAPGAGTSGAAARGAGSPGSRRVSLVRVTSDAATSAVARGRARAVAEAQRRAKEEADALMGATPDEIRNAPLSRRTTTGGRGAASAAAAGTGTGSGAGAGTGRSGHFSRHDAILLRHGVVREAMQDAAGAPLFRARDQAGPGEG